VACMDEGHETSWRVGSWFGLVVMLARASAWRQTSPDYLIGAIGRYMTGALAVGQVAVRVETDATHNVHTSCTSSRWTSAARTVKQPSIIDEAAVPVAGV